ncbi:hypothetical protein PQR66_07560 [Paraburkholderia agricolaris]|uniref:Uncharacterized protein n=1 Tax=Paraburkholderia agricolaris TaxID=2152888 RepID=A0ABW8ZJM6_9BURK
MRDLFTNKLRGTVGNTGRFIETASELRQASTAKSYKSLARKIHQINRNGPNGLVRLRPQRWREMTSSRVLRRLPLSNELYWTALQLREISGPLISHVETVRDVAAAVDCADYQLALNLVASHRKKHGDSVWGLQAYIACTLRCGAEDAALSGLFDEIRLSGHGMAQYLALKYADIYDQNSTFSGFARRCGRELRYIPKSERRGAYLRQQLLGNSTTLDNLSDFLRTQVEFSYVDAYEGFLTAAMWAAGDEYGRPTTNDNIKEAFSELQGVSDARLHRLSSLLGHDNETAEFEVKVSSPRFRLLTAKCLAQNENSRSQEPPLPFQDTLSSVEAQIEAELKLLLDGQSNAPQAIHNLKTLAAKHAFLPWSEALDAWVQGIASTDIANPGYLAWSTSRLILSGAIDCNPAVGPSGYPWLGIYPSESNEHEFYSKAIINSQTDFDANIERQYKQLNNEYRSSYAIGLRLLSISSAKVKDDVSTALRRCVEFALDFPGFAETLPFEELVGGDRDWHELADLELFDLTIGLHFSSLGERESKNKFNLELACKKLLALYKCSTLAELLEKNSRDDFRVPFILWNVMIPRNLRLVSFLKTPESVDTARLGVCQALLDIKNIDTDAVVAEIRRITEARLVQKVELEIESARIFADKLGIKRWTEKECQEEFLRLKNSRIANLAPSMDEIKLLISSIGEENMKLDVSFERQQEDPLFALGASILNTCFWKQDDGLDHFLSLRIRHGSLSGYLRAPLEKARLVSQGKFEESAIQTEWRASLESSGAQAAHSALTHLAVFQENFDTLIEGLRKDYIQIISKEHPKGLFKNGLHKPVWAIFHAKWEQCESFDRFFELCWEAFEIALETSLDSVRKHLSDTFTRECEGLFESLRRGIDACELLNPVNANLIGSINDAVRGLQEAVGVVTNWFVPFEQAQQEVELRFEQILDVSRRVFANARPRFALEVVENAPSASIAFMSRLLPRISDALFIIFDNAYRHSGFVDGAKLTVNWTWAQESDGRVVLALRVENQLHPSKDLDEVIRGLRQVKAKLSGQAFHDALVMEGGTGLVKLARIAAGSHEVDAAKCVDFGVHDGRFFVDCLLNFMGELRIERERQYET